MVGSSVCQSSSAVIDAPNHASSANGAGAPVRLAKATTSSAAYTRVNGRCRSAADMRASVISGLLSWKVQRVDLDQSDPRVGEADADRRLADSQTSELFRRDQERLAVAQVPANDRSRWTELN